MCQVNRWSHSEESLYRKELEGRRVRERNENGARGNPKGSMDRTGGLQVELLCGLVRRSTMGFYSKGIRFEGGGRQVIGLNRTGKSCRLRWVNYLHPGLKRGKMSPQEERLVLDLHTKLGNRWSRIARKLPGRTDNEIKNYWRTHTRKKAQEKKQALSPSSPSSNSCSSSASHPTLDSVPFPETGEESFYDTGGPDIIASAQKHVEEENTGTENGYSMDDIWKDIALLEDNSIKPVYDTYSYSEEGNSFSCPPLASPSWECCLDSLWNMDEEKSKMPLPNTDQFFPSYEYGRAFLTG